MYFWNQFSLIHVGFCDSFIFDLKEHVLLYIHDHSKGRVLNLKWTVGVWQQQGACPESEVDRGGVAIEPF